MDHADDPMNHDLKRYDRFINFNDRPLRRDKDGKEIPRQTIDLNALIDRSSQTWTLCFIESIPQSGQEIYIRNPEVHIQPRAAAYLFNKLMIYASILIRRDQIELFDTPGLDDTEHFRVLLTEELVKDVDAILFLTVSGASYGQSDKDFIIGQLRLHKIKYLQQIITKSDETFENGVRDARENDDDEPSSPKLSASERSTGCAPKCKKL